MNFGHHACLVLALLQPLILRDLAGYVSSTPIAANPFESSMSAITLRWMAPDGQLYKWEFFPISLEGARQDASTKAEELLDNSEHAFDAPVENIFMDKKIWRRIPDDLLAKILTMLPFRSISRFRSVCRKWHTSLLSDAFLSSRTKSQSWFMLCTAGKLACIFDPAIRKWFTMTKPSSPGMSVIASAGSRLCLGNQVSECRALSIYNPITKQSRNLPQMPRVRLIHKVSMIEEETRYRIMVAGEDGMSTGNPYTYNLLTEVYDSAKNSWEVAGDPLPEASFGSDAGVWCKGVYYCVREMPYGVVMFDVKVGRWSEVEARMPEGITMPALAKVAGERVMMVGRVRKGMEISLWELAEKAEGKEWMKVRTMPTAIRDRFVSPAGSYSPFVCAGVGRSIFMLTYLSPHVLVYDVIRDSWTWLPPDPLFPTNRDFHLLGFPFEPTFHAQL